VRIITGIVVRARRNHATVDVADREAGFFENAEQHRAVGVKNQVQLLVGEVVVGAGVQQRDPGAVLAG
jgi:hypothetical protein